MKIKRKYYFFSLFSSFAWTQNLAELKKKEKKIIFLRLQLAKKMKKNKTDQPFSTIYIIFKDKFH